MNPAILGLGSLARVMVDRALTLKNPIIETGNDFYRFKHSTVKVKITPKKNSKKK
jgi:hypothetical protein